MRIQLNHRKRELLGVAITGYEKLHETTRQNLEMLGSAIGDTAEQRDNAKVVRTRMASTGEEQDLELTQDLQASCRRALDLHVIRIDPIRKSQLRMAIPLHDTEHTIEEVEELRDEIIGQKRLGLTRK